MSDTTSSEGLTSEEQEALILSGQDPNEETAEPRPTPAEPAKPANPVDEKRFEDQTAFIRKLEQENAELRKAKVPVKTTVAPADWVEEDTTVPPPKVSVTEIPDSGSMVLQKELAVIAFNQKNKVDEETDLAMRTLIYRDDPTLKSIWDRDPKAALKIAHKLVRADQLERQVNTPQPLPADPQRLNAKSEQDLGHQSPEPPVSLGDMRGMTAAEQEKIILSQFQPAQ